MIPNKDLYADKDGKLTEDPSKFAIQIATAGVNLDERIAKRYGITDSLVSTEEPGAVRPVRGKAEIVEKADDGDQPSDESKTDEPKADEPKAAASSKKAAAKAEGNKK